MGQYNKCWMILYGKKMSFEFNSQHVNIFDVLFKWQMSGEWSGWYWDDPEATFPILAAITNIHCIIITVLPAFILLKTLSGDIHLDFPFITEFPVFGIEGT